MRPRFDYCFFSPELHHSKLASRFGVHRHLRSTGTLSQMYDMPVIQDVQQAKARCDFAVYKVRISYRSSTKSLGSAKNPSFGIISLWEKSLYGRTLTNIKSDPDNFASLISARLAQLLGIPFYEYVAECHSKHRVGAVFSFGAKPPKEHNIIVLDDFVTTGATILSMKNLLEPLGKNLVFFTGINNKL